MKVILLLLIVFRNMRTGSSASYSLLEPPCFTRGKASGHHPFMSSLLTCRETLVNAFVAETGHSQTLVLLLQTHLSLIPRCLHSSMTAESPVSGNSNRQPGLLNACVKQALLRT